jgi:hypothetical protein
MERPILHRPIDAKALRELKAELVRLGASGDRAALEFARRMFELFPELRAA